MICTKNLTYSIQNHREIIKDLSVDFPQGKITVITGANGSGKSTLIKLLMGILSPTSGKIFYQNKDITNQTIAERAKSGISVAFQQPVSFKGITVRRMMEIAGGSMNIGEICTHLSKVGLCAKDYVDRTLDSNLSGGEMKRIELATCLAKGGEVFLFDEPEAGIDLWSFENLVKLFSGLSNKTIIIVSHQQKILEIADYILLMNKAGSVDFGPAKEMLPKLSSTPVCHALEENL